MFLSTQSVSRPKRDSIYSFMRHSGPLGCITTEIFSENHCCLKRRFSENLDSTVSTGQLEQKMTLFAIFQDDSCGQSSWKIAKTVIFCSSWPVETVLSKFSKNLPLGNFMFLLNIILDMHRNTSEMNKNNLIWVRTHFGYFDPRFGVIILLF